MRSTGVEVCRRCCGGEIGGLSCGFAWGMRKLPVSEERRMLIAVGIVVVDVVVVVVILRATTGMRKGRGIAAHMFRP